MGIDNDTHHQDSSTLKDSTTTIQARVAKTIPITKIAQHSKTAQPLFKHGYRKRYPRDLWNTSLVNVGIENDTHHLLFIDKMI